MVVVIVVMVVVVVVVVEVVVVVMVVVVVVVVKLVRGRAMILCYVHTYLFLHNTVCMSNITILSVLLVL